MQKAAGADPLSNALDAAIRGDAQGLAQFLARASGLPGPKPNWTLAEAFAEACRLRGKPADRVCLELATLDADRAPGATAFEFLPLCGVLALGARAADDEKVRKKHLDVLHASADDLRFRVRDAVPLALADIGATVGDALLDDFKAWTDGYFHAAAVVRAMAEPKFMSRIDNADAALALVDESFVLLREAPRAAARYPGFKALVDALSACPKLLASRFGGKVFDMLANWASSKDPALREIVRANLSGSKVAGRFAEDLKRIDAILAATAPARRDPRTYVGPTRGRGKKKQQR